VYLDITHRVGLVNVVELDDHRRVSLRREHAGGEVDVGLLNLYRLLHFV
jgi:hypothetical protein